MDGGNIFVERGGVAELKIMDFLFINSDVCVSCLSKATKTAKATAMKKKTPKSSSSAPVQSIEANIIIKA